MSEDEVSAVLFDWDGTLYDMVDFLVDVYTHVFSELGLRVWSRREYREHFRSDWREMLSDMGLKEYEDFLVNVWDNRMVNANLCMYPEARRLLDELYPKYLLGVVSSAPKKPLNRELRRMNLTGLIDVIVSGDDVRQKKPSPQPLLKAALKLKVKPTECVYVGDMAEDVQAARKAGMTSVAVGWGLHSKKKLLNASPDYFADDFKQLNKVLQQF